MPRASAPTRDGIYFTPRTHPVPMPGLSFICVFDVSMTKFYDLPRALQILTLQVGM
jgi:hypothetical protein